MLRCRDTARESRTRSAQRAGEGGRMKQGMASLTEIESNECQDPQQDPQRRLGTGGRSKERLSVFDSFPNCLRARGWWGGGTCTHHSVRAPPKDALLEVVDRFLALSGERGEWKEGETSVSQSRDFRATRLRFGCGGAPPRPGSQTSTGCFRPR